MRRMVNLQMSIFGSFESIGADPTLVSELIPLYKNKFIPSIIQMAGIDPLNNTLKNINRLSMVSVDNKITIVFCQIGLIVTILSKIQKLIHRHWKLL